MIQHGDTLAAIVTGTDALRAAFVLIDAVCADLEDSPARRDLEKASALLHGYASAMDTVQSVSRTLGVALSKPPVMVARQREETRSPDSPESRSKVLISKTVGFGGAH